ncbi:aldehyde dehydrogenase family protein [Phaeacidiphilus oryzae]|uniref:aldehyde dehydrogenase family protein n=1 Tax=Phaeacidiphilus oryzae TaxID=348818 RepID=UPI0005604CB5|nr:aldehyde dehydrogenase family protein [Phaeacidiphilus oryzae]
MSDQQQAQQARLGVPKTYKLFVGGRFPRSESGRVYEVAEAKTGSWLANAPRGTRKDARDAVAAARGAFPGWSAATAYNRGQVLYRVAELLQGRREQFADEVAAAEGLTARRAAQQVDAAIDRWVWYAGWTDKIAQVAGSANPVAGPYFNLSAPEPVGVVGVVAPQADGGSGHALLGLVSVLAPVLAAGNTAVVLLSSAAPLPGLSLGEVLATSDVPAGVVNLLSAERVADVAPTLASHADVNALALPGRDAELEAAAAETLKRVFAGSEDWSATPNGTRRLLAFCETKTVWHPVGS